MNAGISVCVLLAALSTSSCLALPTHSQDEGPSDRGTVAEHYRHTRAAPPGAQLNLLSETDEREDPRSSLTELLARIISAKGNFFLPMTTYLEPFHYHWSIFHFWILSIQVHTAEVRHLTAGPRLTG